MALRRYSSDWWMAFGNFRSSPLRPVTIKSGYLNEREWPTGKRDLLLTASLISTLVFIALFLGGPLPDTRFFNLETTACVSGDMQLEDSLATIMNITKYAEGVNATRIATSRASTTYDLANSQYNLLGDNDTQWPEPYQLSEALLGDLENSANKTCPGNSTCDSFYGLALTCTTSSDYFCGDAEAAETLTNINEAQQALADFASVNRTTTINVTESDTDELVEQIVVSVEKFMDRIAYAGMLYVLWVALVLCFPPSFKVYRASVTQEFREMSMSISKPMWMAMFVLIWYIYSFMDELNTSEFKLVLSYFRNDPCWMDSGYTSTTFDMIRNVCFNITSNNVQYYAANEEYAYYCKVEGTWLAVFDDLNAVYNCTLADALEDIQFPSSCNETQLLAALEPAETGLDWSTLAYNTGIFVDLLFQGILAAWLTSWFSLLHPLIRNRGTLTAPDGVEEDLYEQYSYAESFVRVGAILPCTVLFISLMILLVNMGNMAHSTSSTFTTGGVGILASAIMLFSFLIVPLMVFYRRGPSKDFVVATKIDIGHEISTERTTLIEQMIVKYRGTLVRTFTVHRRKEGISVTTWRILVGFDDEHSARAFRNANNVHHNKRR